MKRPGAPLNSPKQEPGNSKPESAMEGGIGGKAAQSRRISLLSLAGYLAILFLGANLGFVLLIKSQQLRAVQSDLISPILDLLACAILFIAARYSAARSRRMAFAWGIIALAQLFYALGGVAWLILEIELKVPPFPSIADVFFLADYPLFLLGVSLLLVKPATIGELITRGLDILIIFGSAVIWFSVFLIAPIVRSNADLPLVQQGILLAYPVGDLALCIALLMIFYNRSEKQDEPPFFFLAGGLLVTIITDSIYSYQSLLGTYVSGGLLDLGWVVSSLLICLAGVSQIAVVRSTKTYKEKKTSAEFLGRLRGLGLYLPYLLLALIFISLAPTLLGSTPLPADFLVLSLGIVGIVVLILLRQIITLSENNKLNDRLQKSMERIQTQSTELEKANRELQDDIAERRLVEVSLTKSEEFNRNLVEASPIGILYLDKDFKITFENQAMRRITGVPDGSPPPALGEKLLDLASIKAVITEDTFRSLQAGKPIHGEVVHYRSILGREADLDINTEPLWKAGGQFEGTVLLAQDITERLRAEAARKQSDELFRALFELSPDAIVLIDPHDPGGSWPIVDCNMAACRMNGYTRDEMIGHSIDLLNFNPARPAERNAYMQRLRDEGILRLEARHRRKDGAPFSVDISTTLITVGGRELIVGIDHDITDRKRAAGEIKRRLDELEAINKVSFALRTAHTLDEMLPILLEKTLEVIHAAQGSIWLFDPEKNTLGAAVTRGYDAQTGAPSLSPVPPGKGIIGRVFTGGQPYVSSDFRSFPGLSKETNQLISPGIGGAVIPIHAEEDVIGIFMITIPSPRELTPEEVHVLTTLSEIAGNAIRRTSLSQQTNRRLRELTALSQIDRAITSSLDLHLNLQTLLQQAIALLGIHAADVLMYNPASQMLEYISGNGFRTRNFEQTRQRLGEGYAGKAALERQVVHVPNLAERDDNPLAVKAVADEAFVGYYAVPLLAKGQIKGVLEIFHRAPLDRDAEWLDFLNTLAGQAAIAIDNSTLFDNLQRANLELSLAYDATIEGWSRALDLRDKETEGHTQRVSEMTVRLARTFDLSETELVKVRWGALLHDIGKMGIPDEILLKPGPLTDEEWLIMKKHPQFAFEMLSPIQYLRSAIDIPYHHHEKWDGTGYPLGLKGEQIPLAARIFAVVDVWDALCSDRPYRSAWPVEEVREHIRALAGTHFDPRVVKAFLASDAVAGKGGDGTAS